MHLTLVLFYQVGACFQVGHSLCGLHVYTITALCMRYIPLQYPSLPFSKYWMSVQLEFFLLRATNLLGLASLRNADCLRTMFNLLCCDQSKTMSFETIGNVDFINVESIHSISLIPCYPQVIFAYIS
ncbi:hypothetical protein F5B20DRAFT_62473 [Whalleya microplaca]|nr:hypothetical protein F5B20DRAFT_62473 [Whalleya microplaca]